MKVAIAGAGAVGILALDEQDRVVLAQFAQHRVREQLTGPVPARRTEVVLVGLDVGHDAAQHLQSLGHHLWTDAVTGDDRQLHR